MPRLINRPPKYSLHAASGQARVRHNGKTTYLGRYGSPESKAAYAAFIADLPKPEEPAKIGCSAPGATLLVGEIVLKFFEHAKTYYVKGGTPTGEHVTIRCCLRPLVKRFGELPAREFGPKKLKLVREDMIELGWSRRYCNKAVGIVKRCFTWAASEELVSGETAMALKTVQGLQEGRTAAREKPKVEPVSDADIDATLPHVSELVADAIRVMRLTGARPSEALAMTGDAIDRTDPSLWVFRLESHKCSHKDKNRAIMIGPKCQEVLSPCLVKTEPGAVLFPMDRTSLRRAVDRGCKRAGVKNWSPNMVRHTFGTVVRAGHGLEAAQCLLGHSRADVTQTYAERDMRLAREIAIKIG
ncbi:MAG: tyrosine-type recombinase/integrase [Isosphaeraceae bacterium]